MSNKKAKKSKKKKQQQKQIKSKINNNPFWKDQSLFFPIAAVLLITFVAFIPSLWNDFVNWDDPKNLLENKNVVVFDWPSIKAIFTETVMGGYNPLSIFTFAIENALFGLNPKVFHFTNLILHLISVFFAYRVLLLLKLNPMIAAFAALLFGIHPMRVESVAWVTERKDVLMGAFYFSALFYYIRYLQSEHKKKFYFGITILLFILALFSKIQSVAFPLTLVLVDYYFNRPLSDQKVIKEKVPFFLLSLLSGLLGVYLLYSHNTLADYNEENVIFSLPERFLIGSYSLCTYLGKFIFPWKMSPLYPYPQTLSTLFYVAPLGFIAFLGIILRAYQKDIRWLVFGLAFFFLNIVFVLQFLGAGQGFLADRFTYIPYFGLFFILAYGLNYLMNNKPNLKNGILIFAVIYLLIFAGMTWKQNGIWKNGETLWTQVIESNNDKSSLPYRNRGYYLKEQGNLNAALKDYNKALSINPDYGETYVNRGRLYFDQNKHNEALADFNKAIELKPELDEAHINRGATYCVLSQFDKAIIDFNKAEELNPKNKNVFLNRSLLHQTQKNYPEALKDYNTYMEIDPYNPEIIFERGLTNRILGNLQDALDDLNKAISFDSENGRYFLERAKIHNAMNNIPAKEKDKQSAKKYGVVDPNF